MPPVAPLDNSSRLCYNEAEPRFLLLDCEMFQLGFIAPLLSPPQRGGGTAAAVGEERGFQKTMWVSAAKRVYLSRMIHTKKAILCGSPHPPSFGWSPFPAGEGKRTINPNLKTLSL